MKRWAMALVLAAAVVPGLIWAFEFVAVDRCLDRGGVFDFSTGRCALGVTHLPYIPFTSRHLSLILVSATVGLVGVAVLVRSRVRPAVA